MSDTVIIWLTGLTLTALAVVPALLRRRRAERSAHVARAAALDYGLHEPVSLHPVVDTELCIGSGSCVEVCPESVLGLIAGQAVAIAPARCVGHGLCERACPVDAIRLVFGTASRGVELPRIRENFETNVPGIYIIGELGGMGLIRNAFEQGRQCIAGIARESGATPDGMLDAVVVGCGPAGLSAALELQRRGLRFTVLEREGAAGGAVLHYPRRKLVMTHPFEVPGWGRIREREISKERLVEIWTAVESRTTLPLVANALVDAVVAVPGGFIVRATAGEYRTRRVILAIGRRGIPRRLGVPGEDGANVYHALAEPESFAGRRVLVTGGGDSAVEAALMLADHAASVHLSYRGSALARVKPVNLQRFEDAVGQGRVRPLWSSTITRIVPGTVHYTQQGTQHSAAVDDVFVFIGGELPTRFLQACGIALDTRFGEPVR
ncbi:MAG TPA: FAD-dependent oxidoreductase [Longimicrobiales bacterium]|nr:FAD-dependent oxidoreductase [Longimicrobiales bacterium]